MKNLNGIHHISAITADATQNVRFYVGVMGLRLVKKTVNQDNPSVYHLFYADEDGSPGADLTFFEYPGLAGGRAGAGMIHRIGLRVGSEEALGFWAQRLATAGQQEAEQNGDSYAHDSIEAQLLSERIYRKITRPVDAKTAEELSAKRNKVMAEFLARLQHQTRVRYEPGFAPSS